MYFFMYKKSESLNKFYCKNKILEKMCERLTLNPYDNTRVLFCTLSLTYFLHLTKNYQIHLDPHCMNLLTLIHIR